MKIFRRRGASQERDPAEQAIQEYGTAYERGLAAEQSQGPTQALAEFARAQHALDRLDAASPDLPELPQARAGLLYAIGRARTDVGDVSGAVAALDQAEELYQRMESEQLATREESEQRGDRQETGPVPAVLLTADVRLRRARAYAEWDRPFSALSDLDTSIGGYMRAGVLELAVEAVDPESVANPRQVRALVAGVREQGRRGRHLEAFFRCLYYAAMRPAEAAAPRVNQCHLPKTGWGMLPLRQGVVRAGHSIAVLHKVYAKVLDRTRERAQPTRYEVRHVHVPSTAIRTARATQRPPLTR